MVTITNSDKFMGAALTVSVDAEGVARVDGHRISTFSVVEQRAYTAEPGDDAKSATSIGYWELTAEQAAELLEKAPALLVYSEVAPKPTMHLVGTLGRTACGRLGVPSAERTHDVAAVTCEACAESQASS